ncbi:hypothetical protein HQ393_07910 [Chitinibacter bivalviorum]|uniref:Uncharacterized protein n=1 Tax=Chitinibacter bivalviorum TaxID=2739434 RepID=A0A7H9BI12_9NEIS|nr:hypothetical protein [Chitinibacter bivalviorum]QLG88179.1 hypothetical protein HQ393_07910 [Chitinibacter bivalviorum]
MECLAYNTSSICCGISACDLQIKPYFSNFCGGAAVANKLLAPMQRPDSLETWLFLLNIGYGLGSFGIEIVVDSNASDRKRYSSISLARELLEADLLLQNSPWLPDFDL